MSLSECMRQLKSEDGFPYFASCPMAEALEKIAQEVGVRARAEDLCGALEDGASGLVHRCLGFERVGDEFTIKHFCH